MRRMTTAVAGGILAAALGASALAPAAADVPTGVPVTYDAFPAIQDPGSGASDYFQPLWLDDAGSHIQAHGGQIVEAEEDGQTVYYWYGEDRSNDYYGSPGVHVYRSTDAMNWTDEGVALRSVQDPGELESEYFDALYDTVDDAGQPRAERIDELSYHLNTNQDAEYTTIFERPKVLFNEQTGKWVMWWHSDGQITPGGSMYARSMAGVAVSDSPTGPFEMTGVYRMPNRADYRACTSSAVPGQARDMTVHQDDDGSAYIVYSSEENYTLYIAALDETYTNVTHTTDVDMADAGQYSADGRYPYLFADGTAEAPVRGEDFQIVKECGHLEAPALFEHGGRYYALASGATGWAPNPQTYYTSDDLLGSWIRGVEAGDAYENVRYDTIPEGGDGLTSIGDARRSTFGSQSTNVLDLGGGRFVYMGDRWNSGAADSTYVWLPITIGENGAAQLRNPAAEDPDRWGDGWDASYWDGTGLGDGIWSVVDDRLPDQVATGEDFGDRLPATVPVDVNGEVSEVAVAWSTTRLDAIGPQTITGTLAADDTFSEGRIFLREIDVQLAGGDLCRAEGTTVSASFHQTDWETMPAEFACDGDGSTAWSTWDGDQAQDRATFTIEPAEAHTVDRVAFTNIEGTIESVSVDYRDASGDWHATTAQGVVASENGQLTMIPFDAAPASAVRLTFETPGSYLKIPVLALGGGGSEGSVTATAESRCVGSRAHVVVTAANAGDQAVDLLVETAYGSRTLRDVAPGGASSVSFNTREAQIPAGETTVSSSDESASAGYSAASCG
ncbi:family 43 glycosylhydrolase [Microbacterium karelineae]|uniref:family 43 glycosylhydrolase n=1 Tax=Microbacterium karelineae TaxID=2654283 RepID=UPI001E36AAB9|nr:family 43 glycosylhydrolase [Microbacterium karelineae]